MQTTERLYTAIISSIVGAMVAILVTSISPLTAQNTVNWGDMVCTSLKIVDPKDGSEKVVLERASDGGGVVWIFDSGGLGISDAKGNNRVFLTTYDDGAALTLNEGHINITDKNGRDRIVLSSGVHAGFLNVSGSDKSMLKLGGDKDGGFLVLNDENARRRFGLAVESRGHLRGAVLEMFNKDDTRILQAGAAINGGIALVWDKTGTTWAGLSANEVTGALVIKDSTGDSRSFPPNY